MIEPPQCGDGVAAGENEIVDARGAPYVLEFTRPA